jgi:two-component system, cell cycle response regulator DivK
MCGARVARTIPEADVAGEPILIVDDNLQNLKLARVILATEGYNVRTAADAEEALARLRKSRPLVILMDLQLPGMDGLQLTRQLKGDPATRGIRIIALTAYAMKGDEEKAFAAGCDGYLSKPIDAERLLEIVRSHLSGRGEAGSERIR